EAPAIAGLHRVGERGMGRYAREMIRLLVVDDHPAVATAIAATIRGRTDIEIAGTAPDADTAIRLVEATGPDVVVCDLWLGGSPAGLDVLAAIVAMRRPPRVLVVSGF